MHKMTLLSKLTITLSENGNYFMSTILLLRLHFYIRELLSVNMNLTGNIGMEWYFWLVAEVLIRVGVGEAVLVSRQGTNQLLEHLLVQSLRHLSHFRLFHHPQCLNIIMSKNPTQITSHKK